MSPSKGVVCLLVLLLGAASGLHTTAVRSAIKREAPRVGRLSVPQLWQNDLLNQPKVQKKAPEEAVSGGVSGPDLALAAVSGERRYQKLLEAFLGCGLFGSSAAVWIMPLLLDGPIGIATGLSKPELVTCSMVLYAFWAAGCGILSPLGDRAGRKPILIGSALLGAVGFLCAASIPAAPGSLAMPLLLTSRAASGFAVGGIMSQSFALACESSESVRGKEIGVALNLYYCVSVVLVAGFHWTCTALGVAWSVELGALGAWFGLCALASGALAIESPPYLLASGRREEAHRALRSMASWNGVDARRLEAALEEDPTLLQETATDSAEELQQTASARSLTLLSAPLLTGLLGGAFFAASSAWFVLNLSAGSLSDSTLVNLVLLNLVDLPAYAVAGSLAQRFGTREVARALFLASGLALSALSAASEAHVAAAVVTCLALVGKGLVSGAFALMWVLPVELYPTTLVGAGLGFANVCGRLGGILAPVLTSDRPLSLIAAVCCAITVLGAAALEAIGSAPSYADVAAELDAADRAATDDAAHSRSGTTAPS